MSRTVWTGRTFQRWVSEHHGTVWAVSFAVLRDRASADEVVQETFLLAYRRGHEVTDGTNPGPWLRSVARHRAIDRLRRRRLEVEAASREPVAVAGVVPTSAPEAAIAEAFEALDEESRALLLQFHLEGRSTRELAEGWGLSDDAVRKRLSRARAVLRDEYSEQLSRWARPPRTAAVVAAAVLAATAVPAQAASVVPRALALALVVFVVGVAWRWTNEPSRKATSEVSTMRRSPVAEPAPRRASVARGGRPRVDPAAAGFVEGPARGAVRETAEPAEVAFREAAGALAAVDDVELVECELPLSMSTWQRLPRSHGWAIFRDHVVLNDRMLAIRTLSSTEAKAESTLVFQHVSDPDRRLGLRVFVEPGSTGAACHVVRLGDVTEDDVTARVDYDRPEGWEPEPFDPIERLQRIAERAARFEAGDHPLLYARATEGLSAGAMAIIDGWIAEFEDTAALVSRMDLATLPDEAVVRRGEQAATIYVEPEVFEAVDQGN